MRRLCTTLAVLLIGIITPILACSDNSRKTDMNLLAMPVSLATPDYSTATSLAEMPWSENKNLSDRDINKIGQ